jgi:hypothetical protein
MGKNTFEFEPDESDWELFEEFVAPPNVASVISRMSDAERYLLSQYAYLDYSLMLHDGVRGMDERLVVEGMMYLIMKYLYAEEGKPMPVLVDTIGGKIDMNEIGEPEIQWRLDYESPDQPSDLVIERYADIRYLRPDYRLATSSDFNHPREAYEPWVNGFESATTDSKYN